MSRRYRTPFRWIVFHIVQAVHRKRIGNTDTVHTKDARVEALERWPHLHIELVRRGRSHTSAGFTFYATDPNPPRLRELGRLDAMTKGEALRAAQARRPDIADQIEVQSVVSYEIAQDSSVGRAQYA